MASKKQTCGEKLIEGRFPHDGAVAAIAMFSGMEYEEALELCETKSNWRIIRGQGMTVAQIQEVLDASGFRPICLPRIAMPSDAILIVPALGSPGEMQAIYYNGETGGICDPSPGESYGGHYDVSKAYPRVAISIQSLLDEPVRELALQVTNDLRGKLEKAWIETARDAR